MKKLLFVVIAAVMAVSFLACSAKTAISNTYTNADGDFYIFGGDGSLTVSPKSQSGAMAGTYKLDEKEMKITVTVAPPQGTEATLSGTYSLVDKVLTIIWEGGSVDTFVVYDETDASPSPSASLAQ